MASVNGYFSGYPIFKIKVDGKEVKGDTPAILFNGRIMVPLAFVGQSLGTNVTWDAANETALVSNGGSASFSGDIATLKLYSQISANYIDLVLLGERLIKVNDALYLAGNGYLLNQDLSAYNEGLTRFLLIKDDYNRIRQNMPSGPQYHKIIKRSRK